MLALQPFALGLHQRLRSLTSARYRDIGSEEFHQFVISSRLRLDAVVQQAARTRVASSAAVASAAGCALNEMLNVRFFASPLPALVHASRSVVERAVTCTRSRLKTIARLFQLGADPPGGGGS